MELDHSELGEPLNGFRYKFLEPQEYDAVLALLEKYLFRALMPIGYDPEHPEDWRELFTRMMKRGTNMSYVAIDIETGEVAACRMVDLIEKDVSSDLNCAMPPFFKYKKNIDIIKLCGDMCKDENLFTKYGITRYADMFGLCVDEKYRQRGIAGEMYRRGLNYLQKRGFRIVKCSFISPFTRRAGYKNGYKAFAERYFHDCKDEQGNILNPKSDPSDLICFGVFDLKDRQIQ